MRKVIAVGQSSLDIVHVDRRPVASFMGGRIANMAVSLSRAGVPVEFVSECGTDSVGDLIVDTLMENGVATASVDRFTEGSSQISLIFRESGRAGERYSEYVKYPQTRFDVLWPKIEENDIVVFGSYFSIDKGVRAPLRELLAYAVERKALIVYLPGFQPELCSRITRVMPAIFENLELADIVVARESDMVKIFEKSDPERCYEEHIRFYSPYFLFSDAAFNVTLHAGGEILTLPSRDTVPANKLGWNASLCAGFVYGLIAENLKRENLSTAGKSAWENVLRHAGRFASDNAVTGGNFISASFSESIKQKR